jgi:hypothetical protein
MAWRARGGCICGMRRGSKALWGLIAVAFTRRNMYQKGPKDRLVWSGVEQRGSW